MEQSEGPSFVLLTPNGISCSWAQHSVSKVVLGAGCNFIFLPEVFYNVKIVSGSVSKLITRNSHTCFPVKLLVITLAE